ncbi:FAD-dependent oxidoreductase [Ruegeria sp. HKCCD4884]|uniref:oxidoreductase n=1 Tax=Ruegeria sp. HKCCD4884 TaxID=2683022 RepID=UPI0014919BCA|nr:FAD-dependent oxidoreductase [Ruegeria sp. HKCCD4884]NOD95286.1 FAD-dependent oxidoreductase [Ruegeria sp. HKCCD4884]
MTAHAQFPLLMSPLDLGSVTLKNRIVSTGHGTRHVQNNKVGDTFIAYHEARARGGAGLIITEAMMIDENSVNSPGHLYVGTDDVIPGLTQLADAVHAHGCKLFGQVFHLGLEQMSTLDGRRAAAYGPSGGVSERYHVSGRTLSRDKIAELIAAFAAAARRIKVAGLDGVEIAASHGYLIAQFLSPQINMRTDDYGGSLENRMRFLTDVMAAIRHEVGADMPVGVRISGDELASDGLTPEEVLEVCDLLDATGDLAYLNITSGSSRQSGSAVHIVPPMSTDIALTAGYAAAIRKRVSMPVMAVGRINRAGTAEQVLSSGQADFCGMTRALITDPEFPNKLAEGRADDVRVCIGCNQACIDRMHRGFGVSCIQHPETGRELTYGMVETAKNPKRVMVVGGGPGGLKAAAAAAVRGHDVTLYEAENRLGGQANIAQLLPRRAEFGGIIGNLEKEARDAGAKIITGTRVTREKIEAESPDTVILATGARVFQPPIDGIDEAHVVNAWDVLEGRANIGARVVIADWRCDWIGLGLAEKLAKDGCSVRLVSTGHVAGETIPRYMRDLWLGEMHKLGVEMIPMARLFGVDEDSVYFQHIASFEPVICEDVDTVVLSQGHEPVTELEQALQGWPGKLHVIGDALAARTAEEAVLEGLEAGANP